MKWILALVFGAGLWGQGRVQPPASPGCARDQLTAFTGVITSYQRSPTELRITVRTDDSTTERFTLRHRKGEDVAKWFLFGRERFEGRHWPQIEPAPGRLRRGARATVWVCEGGSQPVVDWEPPRK